MITQVSSSLYQQLVGSFEDPLFAKGILEDRRKEAFEKFKNVGFPTSKNEEWRFTNIQALLNDGYQLGAHFPGKAVNVDAAKIEGVDAYQVVLVNGVYRHDLSDTI